MEAFEDTFTLDRNIKRIKINVNQPIRYTKILRGK